MDSLFNKRIAEIKELLIKPQSFWGKNKVEESGHAVFVSYLLPLLTILALAVFVGEFFKRSDFFFEYPIIKAIRIPLLFLLQYFVSVFFTRELMQTFGIEKNVHIARNLIAFSLIPFVLISIFTGLIPYFVDLNLLGLYGFYLFWVGARELIKLPEEKINKYILISSFVNFFVFLILHVVLSKIGNYILYVLN